MKKKRLSKIEIVKESQRLIIENGYSVMSAKIIGDFIKNNLETGLEYYKKHKKEFDKLIGEAGK